MQIYFGTLGIASLQIRPLTNVLIFSTGWFSFLSPPRTSDDIFEFLGLQKPTNGRTHHSSVSSYVYFRVFIHLLLG